MLWPILWKITFVPLNYIKWTNLINTAIIYVLGKVTKYQQFQSQKTWMFSAPFAYCLWVESILYYPIGAIIILNSKYADEFLVYTVELYSIPWKSFLIFCEIIRITKVYFAHEQLEFCLAHLVTSPTVLSQSEGVCKVNGLQKTSCSQKLHTIVTESEIKWVMWVVQRLVK